MKTLTLLRHAKSDWGDDRLDDHDRPLAPRGEQACARIGAWLARETEAPQLVLCSSALRARQTLERVVPHLPTRPAVRVEDSLYLAGPSGLLDAVKGVEDEVTRLLLVGHNPGMHALAVQLAGRGDARATSALRRKFPTGAVAVLRFDAGSWAAIDPVGGELRHFVTPRSLAE